MTGKRTGRRAILLKMVHRKSPVRSHQRMTKSGAETVLFSPAQAFVNPLTPSYDSRPRFIRFFSAKAAILGLKGIYSESGRQPPAQKARFRNTNTVYYYLYI